MIHTNAFKFGFSGILVCEKCGALLRRRVRTMGSGKRVDAWACTVLVNKGRAACDSHHVREDVLERTYTAAIRKMTDNAENIIATIKEGTEIAMQPENAAELQAVETEIQTLQDRALELHKNKQWGIIQAEKYEKEIRASSERMRELEKRKEELKSAAMRYAEVKTWLNTFERALSTGNIATPNDAGMIKTLVEKIVVSDDWIEVEFKCGGSVKQEYIR